MVDESTTTTTAGQSTAEQTTQATGQAQVAATQQAGQQQSDATDTQGGEEEVYDKNRAMATIHKLREQEKLAKQQTKELEALRAEAKKHQDAELSETDKLRKRVAELELQEVESQRERQERIVRYEVMLAAQKMNLVDPDAAYKLLDLTGLEFGDDGSVKDIETALKELIKARPYLVKAAQAATNVNAGDGTGTAGQQMDPKAREAKLKQRFRL